MAEPTTRADEEGEGDAGGGEGFGRPQMKPDLQTLGDAAASAAEGEAEGSSGGGAGRAEPPPVPDADRVGDWEFHQSSMMIFHRRKRRRLMLEQLDSASKLMKVIIGLGSQPGWQVDDLVKVMDRAAKLRFQKSLYQVFAHVQDTAVIDWVSGQVRPEPPRGPGSSPGAAP